jgi:hypothetical protein
MRGNVEYLHQANLDWRYGGGIWGIKDPRFCTTLMSWYEAGLLGGNVGLIRMHREPLASARSLLQHPELAAQLCDASLDFKDVTNEEFASKTSRCISTIDRFIDSLMTSGMTSASTRDKATAQH